jgi:hypothetical protein
MTRNTLGKLEEPPPSQAPDAGLAAIAAGFQAAIGPRREPPPEQMSPYHGEADRARPEDVWLLDLSPETIAAAGTIDPTGGDWACPTSWHWRITEVSIVLGTGATLVTVYKQSALSASPLFQTNSTGTWEPADCWLNAGQRLVAVSTGGGCTVWPWGGQRVASHFLPTYLA